MPRRRAISSTRRSPRTDPSSSSPGKTGETAASTRPTSTRPALRQTARRSTRTGFRSRRPTGLQWTPEVASDGTNFLVVWTDSAAGNRGDVLAARVTPQGEVLDPGGFVLTEAEQLGGYRPHAAFDGENYLVTYENCYCIRGIRVAPDGTILEPGGFTISSTSGNLRNGVSYGDGEYLVTWHRTPASSARGSGPTAGFSIRTGSRSRRTNRTDTRSRCRHSTARTSSSRGKTDAGRQHEPHLRGPRHARRNRPRSREHPDHSPPPYLARDASVASSGDSSLIASGFCRRDGRSPRSRRHRARSGRNHPLRGAERQERPSGRLRRRRVSRGLAGRTSGRRLRHHRHSRDAGRRRRRCHRIADLGLGPDATAGARSAAPSAAAATAASSCRAPASTTASASATPATSASTTPPPPPPPPPAASTASASSTPTPAATATASATSAPTSACHLHRHRHRSCGAGSREWSACAWRPRAAGSAGRIAPSAGFVVSDPRAGRGASSRRARGQGSRRPRGAKVSLVVGRR